jgi:hypothetical protein
LPGNKKVSFCNREEGKKNDLQRKEVPIFSWQLFKAIEKRKIRVTDGRGLLR